MKRQLQFVHIGKCGGSTVEKLLPLSPIVAKNYSSFFESHVSGVQINVNCDYLFCIRNPIERAFSAFEWRKKLVLEDQLPDQVNRFPGEKSILMKYGDLGSISRSLYFSDGRLNQDVARDFLERAGDFDAARKSKIAFGFIQTAGAGAGMLAFGPLAARLGSRKTFAIMHLMAAILTPMICWLPSYVGGYTLLLVLLPVFGFFAQGK